MTAYALGKSFLIEIVAVFSEMAPYLLVGFFAAALLKLFVSESLVSRYLGRGSIGSVLRAALFGIPLPLCSCSVLPAGISLRQRGASKGATVSFLTSTPQTGVDSIMVTWSFMGLAFAIWRVLTALVTGVVSGVFTNILERGESGKSPEQGERGEKEGENGIESSSLTESSGAGAGTRFRDAMEYGFIETVGSLSKWLLIGVVLSALVSVFVPDNLLVSFGLAESKFLQMIFMLLIGLPMYICATGSVPIAMAFMMKGFSPGAALVFLMAGPATNMAAITVISRVLGRRTLMVYLGSMIGVSLLFGAIFDMLVPEYSMGGAMRHQMAENPFTLLKIVSSILLLVLMINAWLVARKSAGRTSGDPAENQDRRGLLEIPVEIMGMTCDGCRRKVAGLLEKNAGVNSHELDRNGKGSLFVEDEGFSREEISDIIKKAGYDMQFK